MAQMNSIQVRQGWALLHGRQPARPQREVDAALEAERALAARQVEARLLRQRERAFAEFTRCARPYF